MSLAVDVEIESTDTAVKRCTQALIDCGATGCFIVTTRLVVDKFGKGFYAVLNRVKILWS
jgi:predicted aspartyl protease